MPSINQFNHRCPVPSCRACRPVPSIPAPSYPVPPAVQIPRLRSVPWRAPRCRAATFHARSFGLPSCSVDSFTTRTTRSRTLIVHRLRLRILPFLPVPSFLLVQVPSCIPILLLPDSSSTHSFVRYRLPRSCKFPFQFDHRACLPPAAFLPPFYSGLLPSVYAPLRCLYLQFCPGYALLQRAHAYSSVLLRLPYSLQILVTAAVPRLIPVPVPPLYSLLYPIGLIQLITYNTQLITIHHAFAVPSPRRRRAAVPPFHRSCAAGFLQVRSTTRAAQVARRACRSCRSFVRPRSFAPLFIRIPPTVRSYLPTYLPTYLLVRSFVPSVRSDSSFVRFIAACPSGRDLPSATL